MDSRNDIIHPGTGIDRLLGILAGTGKNYNIEKICQAYNYAASLHEGQFRASGEPYISHPLAVAEIVAGLELDSALIRLILPKLKSSSVRLSRK